MTEKTEHPPKGAGNVARLTLDGVLTIQRIVELKDLLTTSIQQNDCVEIFLEEVADVDLSFLQLLCSAHHTAVANGKELTVAHGGPEIYQKTIAEAGFARHVGCHLDPHKNCLWKEG